MQELNDGTHRALVTPALAGGFAGDDVIALSADGVPQVIARGGNVGVQLFALAHDEANIEALADEAERLGGWLDGFHPSVVVVTFPIRVGFVAIETLVRNYYEQRAGIASEWTYANVYEADGETPIGWWDHHA